MKSPAVASPNASAASPADRWCILILIAAIVALALTAPRHGEFWWSDAPRHALNGVFVADFLKTMPAIGAAQRWAVDYYLQYPALTILFYPPLFATAEAIGFLLFGYSHAVAIGTVMVFYLALALGCYALARRWMVPVNACAVALLLVGFAEVAFWGRQVMTEIPAYALLVWSAYFFDRVLADRKTIFLYAGLFFLLLAVYTKLTIIFILPIYGLLLLREWGMSALRERRIWFAGAALVIGLIPLTLLTIKFGQANIQSVSGIPDAQVSRATLSGWLFYVRSLPHQVGWSPLALAAASLGAFALHRNQLPSRAFFFLATWFVGGYLFFSSIALKEERHTIVLLFPIAVLAIAGLTAWITNARLAQALAIAFGVGNLGYTLVFFPAPKVDGYAEVAHWIVDNTPPGPVMFSGQRDGSFIFNLRVADANRRFAVIRADKMLLNIAVRRELGVTEKYDDPAELAPLFHNYAIRYVVAERDFWLDLKSMKELQELLDSDLFEEVMRFPIAANQPHTDSELRVYKFRGTVAEDPLPLKIDLPIIGQTFDAGSRR